MPSRTFFRLPEEKRKRFLDVAWEEFARVQFDDVSVNKIIQNAQIPRGSFYQYFADKTDLFHYLLDESRRYILEIYQQFLQQARGDLFSVPAQMYQFLFGKIEEVDAVLAWLVRVVRHNVGMDFQMLMSEGCDEFVMQIQQEIDISDYRRTDPEFVSDVFFLVMPPLASAIMDTLRAPEQREQHHAKLQGRIDIIRAGVVQTP